MMTRLMTWFIELRNRFNESRLSKISTIYVLNWVDDLTSWHWARKQDSFAKFLTQQQVMSTTSRKNLTLIWCLETFHSKIFLI